MVTVIFSILEVDGCGFGGWRTFGGKNDALLSLVNVVVHAVAVASAHSAATTTTTWQPWRSTRAAKYYR